MSEEPQEHDEEGGDGDEAPEASGARFMFVSDPEPGDDLPFPETDLSPGLQRTLKRKLDAGEEGTGSRARFMRALRKVTAPKGPERKR